MAKCTIYKNVYDKTNGTDVLVDRVLDGIKTLRWKESIDVIRNPDSEEDKQKAKFNLPSVTFAGTFSERFDEKIKAHSGFFVLDFDHVDVEDVKKKLSSLDYIYSHFTSPSGDGVKALVRIPKSKEKHAGHYRAIIEEIKDKLNYKLDTTSRNLSRLCFVSADENLYKNESATEFTKYLEEEIPKVTPSKITNKVQTDYSKINVAVQMIRNSRDGEKHAILLKASNLIGGYIASNTVDEHIATSILEQEISTKKIRDFDGAKKTIQQGISYGKTMPLYEHEEIENKFNVQLSREKYKSEKTYTFLSDEVVDKDTLLKYKNGGFELGEETGHKMLDEHFRFKLGTWTPILGHANVGKSYFVWWLMVLAAVKHGWKWVVFSSENDTSKIKKIMMEFYLQTPIDEMSTADFDKAYGFVNKHFKFIRIDKTQSAPKILEYASVLIDDDKAFKGILIDPYSSLGKDIDLLKTVGNTHEYDYEIASMFVQFSNLTNTCLFVTMHAATAALRQKHYKGHQFEYQPVPPEAADAEGGGKMVNRATGFFIVIHRYLFLLNENKFTHIHIKKVKDTESGGKHTPYDEPVKFRLKGNMFRFVEEYGDCPIEYNYKDLKSDFDSEITELPPPKAIGTEEAFPDLDNVIGSSDDAPF